MSEVDVTTRFKAERIRSRKHLDWIKTLPCSIPGCRNKDIDPHHLKIGPQGGGSIRSGDDWAVGVCRRHHDAAYKRSVHSFGREADFWALHNVDPIKVAERLAGLSRAAGRLP